MTAPSPAASRGAVPGAAVPGAVADVPAPGPAPVLIPAQRRGGNRSAAPSRARRGSLRALLLVRLVAVVYLSAAGSLLFWSHAPVILGWQPRVVLTGSMLPTVRPGDVVLLGPVPDAAAIGPASVPPGRVVLVRDSTRPSGYYLHRVVRYDTAGRMVTQGDANAVEDHPAVDPERVEGQLRLLVPRVGTPMVWLREGRRLEVALVGGGTWAALVLVVGQRSPSAPPPAPRRRRRAGARAAARQGADRPS